MSVSKDVSKSLKNFKKLYKVAKKKYRSAKTFKQKMERANRRIQAWDKKQLTSNDITMFKSMIKQFNIRAGLGDSETFNPNKWYTKEQQNEIRSIIGALYENKDTSVRAWNDLYQKMKSEKVFDNGPVNINLYQKLDDMFDFEDEQQFITTIDNLNRWRYSEIIRQILSSEQYVELSTYGGSVGLSQSDIDAKIVKIFKETGKTFESLYNVVYEAISNYERFDVFKADYEFDKTEEGNDVF